MRRSGSSSCMLKPKASLSSAALKAAEPLSVTMVNNLPLPSYSTERFYMLSEIELKGYSTLFLSDYACDQTPETAADSDGDDGDYPFPANAVLYILWKSDMAPTPNALTDGVILHSVKQLKALTSSRPCKIYLVVDCLAATADANGSLAQAYEKQVETAARLARCITKSKDLRDELQGLTVGISNHARAAPGLEKCMEAICWGSKDRRKNGDARSTIGIVSLHPDDLVGLEPEPDAVQGVLQSITCAEWNGNGDLMSFAKRAHIEWCGSNKVQIEEEDQPKPKVLPRRYHMNHGSEGIFADPVTLLVSVVFAVWLYMHISTSYDNGINGFLDRVESFLTWKEVNRGLPLDDQL